MSASNRSQDECFLEENKYSGHGRGAGREPGLSSLVEARPTTTEGRVNSGRLKAEPFVGYTCSESIVGTAILLRGKR
jgi:hypothetical protein